MNQNKKKEKRIYQTFWKSWRQLPQVMYWIDVRIKKTIQAPYESVFSLLHLHLPIARNLRILWKTSYHVKLTLCRSRNLSQRKSWQKKRRRISLKKSFILNKKKIDQYKIYFFFKSRFYIRFITREKVIFFFFFFVVLTPPPSWIPRLKLFSWSDVSWIILHWWKKKNKEKIR